MKPTSVIVIGAGIGGITAATHLAQHGMKVTVLVIFSASTQPIIWSSTMAVNWR